MGLAMAATMGSSKEDKEIHFLWWSFHLRRDHNKIVLCQGQGSHQDYFTINDDFSLLMTVLTIRTSQGRDSRHYWGQNMTVPRSFQNMGSINVAG